jgi:hypothetical protein
MRGKEARKQGSKQLVYQSFRRELSTSHNPAPKPDLDVAEIEKDL